MKELIAKRKLTKREWLLIKTLILILLLITHYLYVLQPLTVSNLEIKDKIELANSKILAVNRWINNENELINKLAELEEEITERKQLLPLKEGMSIALKDLNSVANKSLVEITSFKPGLMENKVNYYQLPIALVVKGNYYNIKAFMDEIENLPWLCFINEYKLDLEQDKELLSNCIQFLVILEEI